GGLPGLPAASRAVSQVARSRPAWQADSGRLRRSPPVHCRTARCRGTLGGEGKRTRRPPMSVQVQPSSTVIVRDTTKAFCPWGPGRAACRSVVAAVALMVAGPLVAAEINPPRRMPRLLAADEGRVETAWVNIDTYLFRFDQLTGTPSAIDCLE